MASSGGELRSHLAVVDAEAGRYFGDAPIGEHLATDPAREARMALRERRRKVLLVMAGTFVGCSLVSFLPALGFLRMVALLDLLGLLGFVGFAFYATNAEAFAELLGRPGAEDSYLDEEGDAYAEDGYGYGYAGYDEPGGYDEQWYESRRAIGQ